MTKYKELTLEMLDEFLEETKERRITFATGKQGVLDFEAASFVTVLSKAELDKYLAELSESLEEGIYYFNGISFEYQGRVK